MNLAVLIQSLLFAGLILGLPLTVGRKAAPRAFGLAAPVVYFSALGLGYLFIEIALLEKASYLLGDRTLAFSLVLCGMLVFSGAGSWGIRFLSWPLENY